MKLLTLLAFALTFVSVPFLADAKRCRAHHAYHSGHSGPHFQAFGAGRQEHHAPHPSHQHTTATASTRPLTSATIHKGAKTEGNAAKSPGHWVPQGSVPSSMHRHLPKPIHRPVSTTIMTHSYQSVGNGHPTPSRFSSSPVPPASESKSSSSSVSSSTYTTLALTSSTRSTNGQPVPARFSTSPLRAVSETTSPTVQSSSLQQPSSTHRAPSSTTATRSTVSVPQASSKGISATSSTHTTGSTSSRAPHPSPPGQQPCRSSHWDFRSLPRSSIISNWDTTSAAASLADFIDLSGTPAGTTWALTSEGLVLYLVKPKESGTAALAATMSTTFVLKMGAKVTAEMQTSGVGGAVSTLTMYHPGQDEIDIELAGGVYNTNYFVGGKGQSGTGWESSKLDGSENSDGFHSYSYAWHDEVIRFGFDGATVNQSRRVKNASFWPTHGQTVQFGVWDVSGSPPGTQEWGHGPIDWSKVHGDKITVIFRSLTVDCAWSS